MRSTRFSIPALFGPLVIGGVVIGVGCGSEQASDFSPNEAAGVAEPEGNQRGGETSFGSSDASAPATHPYRGSPLCRATSDTCMPDDDGIRQNTYETKCARIPDGGVPEGGTAEGCRITRSDTMLSPKCGSASPEGTDGVECKDGSDCAPGYECIEGADKNVCRRYCCSGSCATAQAQNGGKTFCDVQKVVPMKAGSAEFNAPVCMPLKACKLLTQGQCKVGETCAIVTEKGETGCVANGTAQVGKSCDEEHCNANLICLGVPGSRTCYALCKLDGTVAPCGPTQVCETNALFTENKDYGVCKDVAQAKH